MSSRNNPKVKAARSTAQDWGNLFNTFDQTLKKGIRILSDVTTADKQYDTQNNRTTATNLQSKASVYRADTQLVKAMDQNEDVVNAYMQKHQNEAQDPDLDLSKKDVRQLKRIKSDIKDAKKEKGRELTPEEQNKIVEDNNFDPARYNKLKTLNDKLNVSKDLEAVSYEQTPNFIAAMKDVVTSAPGSAARGEAFDAAMDALDAMRDEYGVIHLSPVALNVLPKAAVPTTTYRRNKGPIQAPANPLEVNNPAEMIRNVSVVLAGRFNGKEMKADEIQKFMDADYSTSFNLQQNNNGTPQNNNGTPQNNNGTPQNNNGTPQNNNGSGLSAADLEKLKKDDLDKQLAEYKKQEDAVALKLEPASGDKVVGEKGFADKAPQIAKNQLLGLHEALIALAADGAHPACAALAKKLKEHPEQKGKNLGEATIAALAEANNHMNIAEVKTINFIDADASKAVLAAINPKKLPPFVAKEFVPPVVTNNANQNLAKTVPEKTSSEPTKEVPAIREIKSSDELHAFLMAAGKALNFKGNDTQILVQIEDKYKDEQGITANGMLDANELIVAVGKLEEAQKKAENPLAQAFATKEQKKGMKELPATMTALNTLLEKEGIVKRDDIYVDTKALDAGNLGMANGGGKGKSNLVTK